MPPEKSIEVQKRAKTSHIKLNTINAFRVFLEKLLDRANKKILKLLSGLHLKHF
jgi:hypothetical protein